MQFIELNKQYIKHNSVEVDDYYCVTLGNPIEVITIKDKNTNNIMFNVCTEKEEDNYMIKCRLNNKIYFSKDFIESADEEKSCSLKIEDGMNIKIGDSNFSNMRNGNLLFSHYLSVNGVWSNPVNIVTNGKITKTAFNRINILAVGEIKDKLLGLYYIDNIKGIGIQNKLLANKGYSLQSGETYDCEGYNRIVLNDFFANMKVVSIESEV